VSKLTVTYRIFHIKCSICPPCCWRTHSITDHWRDQPNAATVCSNQWRSPASVHSAGWLSWIVDVDRPSVEGLSKKHNWPNLLSGLFGGQVNMVVGRLRSRCPQTVIHPSTSPPKRVAWGMVAFQ